MLRWTRRLRDALESSYLTNEWHRPRLSEMREAEFFREDTNATTAMPDDYDWDALTRCYKHDEQIGNLVLYNVNVRNDLNLDFDGPVPIHDENNVRSLSGQPVIDGENLDILEGSHHLVLKRNHAPQIEQTDVFQCFD
jgi:hypothetical protein